MLSVDCQEMKAACDTALEGARRKDGTVEERLVDGQTVELLDSWTARILDIWTVRKLDSWTVRMLDSWIVIPLDS